MQPISKRELLIPLFILGVAGEQFATAHVGRCVKENLGRDVELHRARCAALADKECQQCPVLRAVIAAPINEVPLTNPGP